MTHGWRYVELDLEITSTLKQVQTFFYYQDLRDEDAIVLECFAYLYLHISHLQIRFSLAFLE
jgi:hypothetical protein